MATFEWLRTRVSSTDVVRLIASLVLALLLWGWVSVQQDPETSRVFPNIPIVVDELPDGLVVVSAVPDATVTVTGPRSVVSDISIDEISAKLDLSEVDGPGTYNVRVEVDTPPGLFSRRVTPSRVEIHVEQSVTQEFVLAIQIEGETDATRRVGEVTPAVTQVTVRGPESAVARVERVVLPIDIGDPMADFSAIFTPVAEDDSGQVIPEVSISPASIRATVEITPRGKSVAVITQLVGTPAQGYDVLERTVNPATVQIDGPREILDDLVVVRTVPIDIDGVSDDLSRRVALELPEGIRVIDPADGQVQVYVQIGRRGVRQPLPGQVVTWINLQPGLTVEVEPREVTVIVVASAEVLANLTVEDVRIQVDLAGLGPGEYQLRPTVSLPPNVQWVRTEPEFVEVTIRSGAGTATPESSPAPSPAAARIAATPNARMPSPEP